MKKYLLIGISALCVIGLVFGLTYKEAYGFVSGQLDNLNSIASGLFGASNNNIPYSSGKDIDNYPAIKNVLPSSLFNFYGLRSVITVDDRAYSIKVIGETKTILLPAQIDNFDNCIRVNISLYDELEKAYNYQVYICPFYYGRVTYVVTKDLYNIIGYAESLSDNIAEWFNNPIEEYFTIDNFSMFGDSAIYHYSIDYIRVTDEPINLDFLES